MTQENLLEKVFDPDCFQADIKGQKIRLSDLSRDDLLQVACEGMQAIEHIDSLQRGIAVVIKEWRKGATKPDPDCAATPTQKAAS